MKIVRRINEWLADESQGKRSLAFLERKTGLSRSLFSKILTGDLPATPETLIKLSPVLGVPAVLLLVEAGYLKESDLAAIQKESQSPIPPDLASALRDPEMVKLFGKLWRWKIDDPPVDLQTLCDRILSLPPDQMALVEGLIKNLNPKPSTT